MTAGLSAAPYLLRLQDWETAGSLLEQVLIRDGSPGTIQAIIPSLRTVADATGAPADLGVLARALRSADPAEAENLLRATLTRAVADGDYRVAAATGGELLNLLRDAGRLREALELTDQMADYIHRRPGPSAQLLDQSQRLQILGMMGQHEQVLAETTGLLTRADELTGESAVGEAVAPWNVRELILDTGQSSALALGRWQQALDLNQAILASLRARGASDYELSYTAFNGALVAAPRSARRGRSASRFLSAGVRGAA